MSTGIHVAAEVKTSKGWKAVRMKNPWYSGPEDGENEYWYDVLGLYHQSYTLFGILSGVRSKEFEPIYEDTGSPKDIDPELEKDFQDLHTHTHFYMTEFEKRVKKDRKERKYWGRVHWKEEEHSYLDVFYIEISRDLKEILPGVPYSKIRIVIAYDS